MDVGHTIRTLIVNHVSSNSTPLTPQPPLEKGYLGASGVNLLQAGAKAVCPINNLFAHRPARSARPERRP